MFAIKGGWKFVAQDGGRWYYAVMEGAKGFIAKWKEKERPQNKKNGRREPSKRVSPL